MEEDGEHAAARESGNSGEDIGCLPLLQQEGSPLLSRPVQALASRAADEATTPQPRRMAILLNRLRVLLLCILYLGIGPSLILINRTILKRRHFPLPMALSGLGLLFSSAVSSVLVAGRCVRLEHREVVTWPFSSATLHPSARPWRPRSHRGTRCTCISPSPSYRCSKHYAHSHAHSTLRQRHRNAHQKHHALRPRHMRWHGTRFGR